MRHVFCKVTSLKFPYSSYLRISSNYWAIYNTLTVCFGYSDLGGHIALVGWAIPTHASSLDPSVC